MVNQKFEESISEHCQVPVNVCRVWSCFLGFFPSRAFLLVLLNTPVSPGVLAERDGCWWEHWSETRNIAGAVNPSLLSKTDTAGISYPHHPCSRWSSSHAAGEHYLHPWTHHPVTFYLKGICNCTPRHTTPIKAQQVGTITWSIMKFQSKWRDSCR